jgi:hypothetical protein
MLLSPGTAQIHDYVSNEPHTNTQEALLIWIRLNRK